MTNIRNKSELAATLFPISGLQNTKFKLRILRVKEKVPNDNKKAIRLQQWADQLWRKKLFCPVFPTERFGYPAFLIPDEYSYKFNKFGPSIEIVDVPDMKFHIELTDEIFEVNIQNASRYERDLICKMIERSITDKLVSLKDIFWKDQWSLFYFQRPANLSNNTDILNAFRGFKFGVVLLNNIQPYLAIDIRTKYIGKKSLADYTKEEKIQYLQDHLDLAKKYQDRSQFLRDNGFKKIPCRYTGETKRTIKQLVFETGQSVFEYYRSQYPSLVLNPDDAAVTVKDREDGHNLPVPASRLFPTFTNDYEAFRNCSIKPQITPNDRIKLVKEFFKYLTDIRYGDTPLIIDQSALIAERNVFKPPNLQFGGNYILTPNILDSTSSSEELFDTGITNYRSSKLPSLYQHGPFHNEPLPGIVLFYPESLSRSHRESFLTLVKDEIKLQTKSDFGIIKQVSYKVGKNEKRGSDLQSAIENLSTNQSRFFALIILWDSFFDDVHGNLKSILKSVPSQCAYEKTVIDIVDRTTQKRAKLRNLALGIITEAGVKPWVISDSLNHDLHIGIDLLYGRIGYHFLYDKGGRRIITESGESSQRGRMHEAIKSPELRNKLIQVIKSIIKQGIQINTIVIHRDGRWWPSESIGFKEAINVLQKEGLLNQNLQYSIVEIHKNHLPIRLFTHKSGEKIEYRNPLPGTYLSLDSERILLTTTGKPGSWENSFGRTASTLLLDVVEKTDKIENKKIAEDIYRLTHLNWSSPDIDISLPVTIRWTDEALRETLRSSCDEEEDLINLVETHETSEEDHALIENV